MYELHVYNFNDCGYEYFTTCETIEDANRDRSELLEIGWIVEIKRVDK